MVERMVGVSGINGRDKQRVLPTRLAFNRSNAARAGTSSFFNSMTTRGRPLMEPTKSALQV